MVRRRWENHRIKERERESREDKGKEHSGERREDIEDEMGKMGKGRVFID